MQNLQQKLAEHHPATSTANWGQVPPPHLTAAMASPDVYGGSRLHNQQEVLEKNDRFRDKILAKLGNVEDSKENSADYDENQLDDNFAEGLEMPSEMDMGDVDLDGMNAADAAEMDGQYIVREQADENSAESPDQHQKRLALQKKLSAQQLKR